MTYQEKAVYYQALANYDLPEDLGSKLRLLDDTLKGTGYYDYFTDIIFYFVVTKSTEPIKSPSKSLRK